MNDVQEINVEEIMAQIQENRPHQQGTPAVGAPALSYNDPVAAELSSLQSTREIRYFHLTSHRKLLGPLVLSAKKAARKLLTPSLERQSEYNTANLRLVQHFWEQAAALQKSNGELAEQITEVRQELIDRVNGVRQELAEQAKGVRQELTEQAKGVRQELTEQVKGVRQELAEQMGAKHHELAEQIGGVHEEQGVALHALRREVAERMGEVHQEQRVALQALRGELAERMGEVHQEQRVALQALRGELAERMGEVHQEQRVALQALRTQVFEQVSGIQRAHAVAFQEMRERSSRAERRVRRLLHTLTDSQRSDGQPAENALAMPHGVPQQGPAPYFDYFGFEERFRGSEADIKERQSVYVEYFKGLDQVLDIGCGRGEFLELLTAAGIKAKGVDLDLDMVLYCQEKELDVIRGDIYAYLESLADESLGGLFAAQLVEHLEPSRVIELVNLAHRKLQSEGILIFETPNPVCLTVFARSFYMDFTHIRPVHPEAMKFLLESAGFQNVQVKFSSPVEASIRIPPLSGVAGDAKASEEFNRGIERLNELLYGFQDYAVIGRK
jgi:SAM-dependent methyltransferase